MPSVLPKLSKRADFPNDPDKAWCEFDLITDQEAADIRKRYPKEQDRIAALIVLGTTAWGNFFDKDRQPMECTPENKRFWSCNREFETWFFQEQTALKKEAAAQVEVARKN